MKLREQVNTPHLAFPLNLVGAQAEVTEQDSQSEIADCVEVILRTPRGSRIDQPDFGTPDPTFRQNGVELSELEGTIAQWEPRADVNATRIALTNLEDHINVEVGGK